MLCEIVKLFPPNIFQYNFRVQKCGLSEALTLDPFGGPNAWLVCPLNKAEFTFHPYLFSKSWHLWDHLCGMDKKDTL